MLDRFEDGQLGAPLLRPKWRRGLTPAETGLMRMLDEAQDVPPKNSVNGRREVVGPVCDGYAGA